MLPKVIYIINMELLKKNIGIFKWKLLCKAIDRHCGSVPWHFGRDLCPHVHRNGLMMYLFDKANLFQMNVYYYYSLLFRVTTITNTAKEYWLVVFLPGRTLSYRESYIGFIVIITGSKLRNSFNILVDFPTSQAHTRI